jgi:hypothetical protein
LLLVTLALASLTVYVGTFKHPNTLAAAILQGAALVVGVAAAYFFARASIQSAAKELVATRAFSAFRRVENIYKALGNLLGVQDEQLVKFLAMRTGETRGIVDIYVEMAIETTRQLLIQQINTADDALADWRDLVPEVQQIEAQAEARDLGAKDAAE